MADPSLARGSILNFTRNQQPDGSFPAYVCAFWVGPREFYHADWGTAVLAVHALHPDREFLAEVYGSLARYAEYFDRVRDPDGTGLYDVINQDETGQEYAPRYLFADTGADQSSAIRLKGVDATVYLYKLKRALARMSEELGTGEERRWEDEAARTREAVPRHMWSGSSGLFVDARVPDLARSPHRSAVGFYPLATDIVDDDQQRRLIATLLDPAGFGTPWPVPSAAVSDPLFSPHAEWKGMRMRRPWNGRVWPMTNSHVCDAVAAAADRDPSLRPVAANLIRRFVELLFWDHDPARPDCFEHYNPFTGEPCAYRGIDDYQHSWVVDLILKYVAGVRPAPDGGLVVNPLPFGLAHFHVHGVPWKGRRIDVSWQCDGHGPSGDLVVRLDGDVVGRRQELGPIVVA
jgi:glycogen debranching enzyme